MSQEYREGRTLMVNVIHFNVHYDDERKITALDIKLKSFLDEDSTAHQMLISRVTEALFRVPLPTSVGRSFKITANPKRPNIININIGLRDTPQITMASIAEFSESFQNSLDQICH